ncbi:MAG: hypothetical protein HYV03_01395 [Deltaproteobacteria bacterium]|nr:hypothetical protein [Deltaproteobacteria bacterium]
MLEETAASEYNCDGELEDATQAVYGALDKWWKWVSLCGGRSNFTTCARKLTNAINGEAMCVDGVNESQLKLLNQVVNVIGLVTDVLTAVKASREEPR